MNISYLASIHKPGQTIPIAFSEYLTFTENGKWQDEVLKYRTTNNINDKRKLPAITPSGVFSYANTEGLKEHSSLLCLDIDEIESEQQLKEYWGKISKDQHTLALHRSCSGKNLTAFVKINPKYHLECFLALQEHYFSSYGISIDEKCKDVARKRFVSYDPDIYVNYHAKTWTKRVTKKSTQSPPVINIVYSSSDFDYVMQQVQDRNVNLCNNYQEWLNVGFALSVEFGESGRDYFRLISQISAYYRGDSQAANEKLVDKQYDKCLRGKRQGVTIGTFFYYCKKQNIQLRTKRSNTIIQVAQSGKKGKITKEGVLDTLSKTQNIAKEEAKELVEKVYNNEDEETELSEQEQLELFLSTNYTFKHNVITGEVEADGEPINDRELNTIYRRIKKELDEKMKRHELEYTLYSDFSQNYNPLKQWFLERANTEVEKGHIKSYIDLLPTDTGMGDGEFSPDFCYRMFIKWYVGIVASVFGKYSNLFLVLTGGKGLGKTSFFRNILPSELMGYYSEINMDGGKDTEILMTQKLIVMIDEMQGNQMDNTNYIKSLLSKDVFSVRRPYGRKNEDMKRLAVLGGTTNYPEILSDPMGNRRFIIFNVTEMMPWKEIEKIDKEKMLMEAYKMYMEGFEHNLTQAEEKELDELTKKYEKTVAEEDIISELYEPANESHKGKSFYREMNATSLKSDMKRKTGLSDNNFNQQLIGRYMVKLGFRKNKSRKWMVLEKTS